jgi:putative ABC transport system permease protein
MIKHYLLSALRNLIRNKVYTVINMGGFAIGLASCILIFLWVWDELSFDRYQPAADRIYRVIYQDVSWTQPRTPHPLPLAMAQDFPEVEQGVSMSPIWGIGLTRPEHTVEYEDRRFDEKEILSADSTFFDMFPFRFTEGDVRSALAIPFGVVITESTARKYFGDKPALGKSLKIDRNVDLTVTGVTEDIPHNTHFTFDFLVSYVTLKAVDRADHGGQLSDYYTWNDFGHFNYIRLAPGADPKKIEEGLFNWIARYINFSPEQLEVIRQREVKLQLQPVTSIHLHSHMVWELGTNGSIAYVLAFSVTALLILLVAMFNFMNLSTARSEKRAREVGVRKTTGARRSQLVFQFLLESFLLTLAAVFLAAILVELVLPAFNSFTGKNLDMNASGRFVTLGVLGLVTLVVGFISGSYPSFYLSSFRPVEVLKGKLRLSRGNLNLRRVLVVFQFAISVFLIICTFMIVRQVHYLQKRDLGFNKEQVLVMPLRSEPIRRQFQAFSEEMKKNPAVMQLSLISNLPGGQFNNNSMRWKEGDETVNTAEMWVDDDFFSLLQLEMKQGRSFSPEFSGDSVASFILNETACKQMNMKDPVGELVTWYGDNPGTVRGKVIGVVKDFHFQSLHKGIGPLIIQRMNRNDLGAYILVRIQPGDAGAVIRQAEKIWKQFEPAIGFNYSFLDKDFEALYKAEARMGTIFRIFAVLAVFIACLGLMGLSAFTAELRTKEIGVRKVHGARTLGILILLSGEIIKILLISCLLAWPLAWYFLKKWLQDYSYHTNLAWYLFVLASLLAVVIAVFTTGWQSWRTARQNPVEVLKYE